MSIRSARDGSQPAELCRLLELSRARTLGLSRDFTPEQLLGPKLAVVNPPLWEIGHLGWFQERWCLRLRSDGALGPSLLANADALYDSAAVAHDSRWEWALPPLPNTLEYLDHVLHGVVEKIGKQADPRELAFFVQLAAFHEQMHCEAFTYTRQTLAYSRPSIEGTGAVPAGDGSASGEVALPGGKFWLGAARNHGFVFDNEKWRHQVTLAPFAIARNAVTCGQFAAFVEDGGYRRRELWCEPGWRWREQENAQAPVYWVRRAGGWAYRVFDQVLALQPNIAMMHVNWFEADAYCRWAGRRLPSEGEWEQAASTSPQDPTGAGAKSLYPWGESAPSAVRANLFGSARGPVDVDAYPDGDSAWGCRQMLGNVWEWTADVFAPFPGFVVDPYREYSQPWFGNHRVLRGGCYATDPALIRNTWRNFYTPD